MRVPVAVLLLLLAGPAQAAGPLAHREILPNGAVLLVTERPAIPIVVVRVGVPAGAVHDPVDAPGVANLTAALLTRGTARRSGPELDRAIEFVGGRLEAGAGSDGATVSLSVLKKDLGLGLDLLAEALLQPAFPAEELARKVTDIQGALRRSEQSPERVAARELGRLIFPGHPYGRPAAGTIESVGRLTREQVTAFYRRHYRPDGANIVAVGDVTVAEIRRELLQRLAGWTTPAAPVPPVPRPPLVGPAEERKIARDLTQTTVLLGRPAIRQDDPDYFPLAVASYVLGGGSASRLYTRVREERGLAYAVYSSLAPGRYGASYLVSLQTRTDGVEEAVRLARAEMARLGREPLAPRELAVAKSYLIGSFPLRLDTAGKLARFLGAVEESGLGLDYPERYKERIGRVTAADVQRVAAKYLDPATFSEVQVGR
ncbi:MAG TPA: pitrilysin family protein [Candidatus Limnocylindria bacterium]|nr:pitrilysin family protein [Candidatus Limnocylindria bacterium]